MFETVLVGVDGRSGGRDATALATWLMGENARLVLANVYQVVTAGKLARLGAGADRACAQDLLIRERQAASIEADAVIRRESDVGRGLHELATHERADLLVVGSSHRGPIGRVLLGDDTLAAARGAPCAVAIAPRAYRPADTGSIIGVGYDGSAESELAVDAARALAPRLRAEIRLLSVVSLQRISDAEAEPLSWNSATENAVRGERRRLAALPGMTPAVTYGQPAQELARQAPGLDLLIIGSHGHDPRNRWFGGGTERRLERGCRCPLLVMPRPVSRSARAEPGMPSRGPRVPATPGFGHGRPGP